MSKATASTAASAASHADEIGHGNSPAAWTTVAIMLVGALVASIAFAIANAPVFWGGVATMFVGLLVGWGLRKAGYGVGGSKLKNSH